MKIFVKEKENRMNIVDKITKRQLRDDIPEFRVGDTVKVNYTIKEGEKQRIQAFEGVVMAKKGKESEETFTVRKISYGVGVERTFPVHSPRIAELIVVKKGKVRRAKLNFLRGKVGVYKIKERN